MKRVIDTVVIAVCVVGLVQAGIDGNLLGLVFAGFAVGLYFSLTQLRSERDRLLNELENTKGGGSESNDDSSGGELSA